jgi:hypothetical protein
VHGASLGQSEGDDPNRDVVVYLPSLFGKNLQGVIHVTSFMAWSRAEAYGTLRLQEVQTNLS